jgi:hypothetical protein
LKVAAVVDDVVPIHYLQKAPARKPLQQTRLGRSRLRIGPVPPKP